MHLMNSGVPRQERGHQMAYGISQSRGYPWCQVKFLFPNLSSRLPRETFRRPIPTRISAYSPPMPNAINTSMIQIGMDAWCREVGDLCSNASLGYRSLVHNLKEQRDSPSRVDTPRSPFAITAPTSGSQVQSCGPFGVTWTDLYPRLRSRTCAMEDIPDAIEGPRFADQRAILDRIR